MRVDLGSVVIPDAAQHRSGIFGLTDEGRYLIIGMEKRFYVYILASKPHGPIYVGVTSDLVRRVWQHKEGTADSHTKRYWIKQLVYFEEHATAEAAIAREKHLKRWRRAWKDDLIESGNRDWRDLYEDIARP